MKLRPPDGWIECRGIFVGGCVERGEGSSFRAKAECHNDPSYPNYGWICVRALKRVGEYTVFTGSEFDGELTKPSMLMLHEYAHLLAPKQGHTAEFYRQLRGLGGHITAGDRRIAPKAVAMARKGGIRWQGID